MNKLQKLVDPACIPAVSRHVQQRHADRVRGAMGQQSLVIVMKDVEDSGSRSQSRLDEPPSLFAEILPFVDYDGIIFQVRMLKFRKRLNEFILTGLLECCPSVLPRVLVAGQLVGPFAEC